MRAVIADDVDAVRKLYASWLLDAGYEVEEASDGHAALEKAMEPGVDMLVLDVMMPGMDGIEVIKRLRAAKSDIYIVAVSGGAPGIPADVALMMAGMFGVDRMLYKPFNHHTLLAVLAEAEAGVPQAAE